MSLNLINLVPKSLYPNKPFILRIRSNVLREMIAFLNQTELLEFCQTCKTFLNLLIDKFVKNNVSLPTPIIEIHSSLVDQAFDYRSLILLREGYYPRVITEWKAHPIIFFHYYVQETRNFFLFYESHSFEIKEMNSYSSSFYCTYRREYKESILKAKGYKNEIILLFKGKLELIILDKETVLFEPDQEKNIIRQYLLQKEKPLNMKFLNSGRCILLSTTTSIYLLNTQLQILNTILNPSNKFHLFVPNKQGKNYLIYFERELRIYKIGSMEPKVIQTQHDIMHVRTANFSGHPQIFIESENGEFYHGTKKLEIRIEGKFILQQENMIYIDSWGGYPLKVLNLESNKKLYKIRSHHFFNIKKALIRPYKLIAITSEAIIVQDLVSGGQHHYLFDFSQYSSKKILNNFIILSGKISDHYAVFVLDLNHFITFQQFEKDKSNPS